MRTIEVLPPVTFAADTTALPVSGDDVRAALELIGQASTVPGSGKVTVRLGEPNMPDVAPAALPAADIADAAPETTTIAESGRAPADSTELAVVDDEAVTLNAASDIIDGVYAVTRYWANYVSLELGPWLINWIPFGYLISDQIYIWYPDFVLPVVDSFVYDFLDPVVDNPLDLSVWIDGIGDIVNTALTGVYNGIVSEIEYVLDFGWFPIPLPPLPDFPLPLAADSTEAAVTLAAIETEPGAEAAETEATEAETPEATTTEAADNVGEATQPVDADATEEGKVAEEPVDEVTEEAVDDAEAPADEQPADGAEPVDVLDEPTDGEPGETLDDIIDESEEPADGDTAEEPATETESEGDAGQPEPPADAESGNDDTSPADDGDTAASDD